MQGTLNISDIASIKYEQASIKCEQASNQRKKEQASIINEQASIKIERASIKYEQASVNENPRGKQRRKAEHKSTVCLHRRQNSRCKLSLCLFVVVFLKMVPFVKPKQMWGL